MSLSQYFTNELEYGLNRVMDDVYPERQIISGLAGTLKQNDVANPMPKGLVPFNLEVPAYQDDYSYNVMTNAGIAEFYTGAADDIPQVSHGRQKVYGKLEKIALGTSWDYYDMQRDIAEGLNMIPKELEIIKRGHDHKLDNIAWFGNATLNIPGLSNFPGVPASFLPGDGTAGATMLATKTAAQMYRDLTTMGLAVSSTTKGVFGTGTLLMGMQPYNALSTTRISTTGDTGTTVLEAYLRTQTVNPFGIKSILPCPILDGKGVFPNSSLGILYNGDPRYVEAFIADYFRVFNDVEGGETSNFKSSLSVISKTGGTVVYQPLSMTYYTGI